MIPQIALNVKKIKRIDTENDFAVAKAPMTSAATQTDNRTVNGGKTKPARTYVFN